MHPDLSSASPRLPVVATGRSVGTCEFLNRLNNLALASHRKACRVAQVTDSVPSRLVRVGGAPQACGAAPSRDHVPRSTQAAGKAAWKARRADGDREVHAAIRSTPGSPTAPR